MRWSAQVVHVARKDLRQFRWLMAAYVAAVGAITTLGTGWSASSANVGPMGMLALVLLGMILFALLIQADPPTRGTPLWVTLPFHPSAVFAAKVAVGLLVLVAVALLGQAAGLMAHAVPAHDFPALLGVSVVYYGIWLGLAGVIAALTPDLRSFFVALVLTTVGWLLTVRVLGSFMRDALPAAPTSLVLPVVLPGALLLVAYQYLTRDMRRGIVGAALLGACVLFLPFLPPLPALFTHAPRQSIPAELRPSTVTIQGVRYEGGSNAYVSLHLNGASKSHHYVLVSPVVEIQMRDGSRESVAVSDSAIWLNSPAPRLAGVRWVRGEELSAREFTRDMVIELSPAQKRVLAEGRARVSVRGRLQVRASHTRAEVPLRIGASVAKAGLRVHIQGVENLADGPAVQLRTSYAGVSPDTEEQRAFMMGGPFSVRYLLVNRRRSEALPMASGGSSSTMQALVLPGPRTESSRLDLVSRGAQAVGTPVSREWLRDAHLVIIGWDPVGSDPVSLRF